MRRTPRRSKALTLDALKMKRGKLKLKDLTCERLIQVGKDRAKEGAGPVTISMDIGPHRAGSFSRRSCVCESSCPGTQTSLSEHGRLQEDGPGTLPRFMHAAESRTLLESSQHE